MTQQGRRLEDLADYERWTVAAYAVDMRKLRRIAMGREALTGRRPALAALIHEAVKAMGEP